MMELINYRVSKKLKFLKYLYREKPPLNWGINRRETTVKASRGQIGVPLCAWVALLGVCLRCVALLRPVSPAAPKFPTECVIQPILTKTIGPLRTQREIQRFSEERK